MTTTGKYLLTDDVGEISGFGGGYEKCCRAMLQAACEWFEAHPGADPQFRGYKGIYGVISEENDDAKELTKVVIAAAKSRGGATGAMHQAVIGHALAVKRLGWDGYVAEMRKPREQ